MIRITRDENKVKVNIEHGVFYGGEHFSLAIEQTYKYQAELLKNQLQKNLNDNLERLKQKYYNEGWKDAKARTAKRTGFYGGWEK